MHLRPLLSQLAADDGDGAALLRDGGRAFVAASLRPYVLAALADADAAIAAAAVTDTIKEADGQVVAATLDRSRLWAVQTPQAFRRAALEDALAQPPEVLAAATDDAGLVEARGGTVRVVESTPRNLKVTTPTDLKLAELLLADRLPPAPAP